MTRQGIIIRCIWFVGAAGLLAYGLFLALWGSPPDALQGNMIRAFYYHFPNWIGAGIFLPLNLVASVAYLYLRKKDPRSALKADSLALATAEMGVVYCILGMVTGSLWGREEWEIWWTWDARLTTTLMLALIYVSYLIVRRMTDGSGRPVICAVLAIFGFLDIPIVYMSTTWWRTQHPAPVFGGEGSVAHAILVPTLWNVVAWVVWGGLIVSIRYAAEVRAQQRSYDDALAAIQALSTEQQHA